MSVLMRVLALVSLVGFGGCGDAETATRGAARDPSASAPQDAAPAKRTRVPAGYDEPVVDDGDAPEPYVPAEFKSGADRWRDTGVYLDGKPIAMLAWAEIPLSVPVAWRMKKVSAPKRYGHPEEKGWKMVKERTYRFTDYLKALGVDVRKVKEMHVYGPKFSESIVVTGKDLRSKAADGFRFRFGGIWSGKALPVVPDDFGNGRTPDKIAAVMIYIEKKPPTLERNVGFVLDGEFIDGVPYFGDPLRGGVRVYLDGKLAAYIKRNDLPVNKAVKDAAGDLSWKLAEVLALQGVSLDKVVEGWIIRDEKWHEKLPKEELAQLTFTATDKAKGAIELGPQKLKARTLTLHTRAVDPARIPARDPDEDI